MIRLTRCTQASKAGTYFRLHLDPGDSQAQPVPPTTVKMRAAWIGTGLREVGLSDLDLPAASHLVRLGRGLHPVEKKRLAPSVNRKRAYYDLTIAAPKTISVAALLDPGHFTAQKVVSAHQQAVRAVCRAVGGMVQGQSRTAPRIEQWVGAVFHHTHTREGDPHLHSHVIVPNLGRNVEGRWRAVQINIAGENRARLAMIYGHELARCLRAFELGPEIVMRRVGTPTPELRSLRPLARHFARARDAVLARSEGEEARWQTTARQPRLPEIHSRSGLPLQPDRIKYEVRQRIADAIRKPKPKDADHPVRLAEEGERWRRRLSPQEHRTLRAVLDQADLTNPRRVPPTLRRLPPALSLLVREAYLRLGEAKLPPTLPLWLQTAVNLSRGRHAFDELVREVTAARAKHRANVAKIRRAQEEDSLAIALAHAAALGKRPAAPKAQRIASSAPAPPATPTVSPVASGPTPATPTAQPSLPARGRGGR